MGRRSSLVSRVAWGAIVSACAASLIAAVATSVVATWLVRDAEDRRLVDAAWVLARELDDAPRTGATMEALVLEERDETEHTGIDFAVFEGERPRAGDSRVAFVPAGSCRTSRGIRACGVASRAGLLVVSAATHTDTLPLFALSAVVASLLAGGLAWVASRRVARWGVAPLTRLERRVAAIQPGSTARLDADLGPAESVAEVEALRRTIETLLGRADRALAQSSRFAADAAHELRTPLTVIRAELELLAEDDTRSSGGAAELARARQHVDRLQALVDRLLILALPAEAIPERVPVDVREVVEEIVASLPREDRARVTLSASSADVGHGTTVDGDPVLLGVLFSNVLTNALKFGHAAVIDVAAGEREIAVTVDDDGPGVPPEERSRVFDAFVRGEGARRGRTPGHGLGLAVVAHVARIHGGTVAFAERPAPGARLEVRLPRAAPVAVRSTA